MTVVYTTTPAEAFASGHAYISAHGWQQGRMGFRHAEMPVCAIGSLPGMDDRLETVRGRGDIHKFMSQAVLDLYGFTVGEHDSVAVWNDRTDTTREMVLHVLEYAKKLALDAEVMSGSRVE